ncbi:hypothetical protein AKJ09_01421 [Labilithrix luteola]|uniref:Flp pilus assembly protein, pilin Flp n=1 Tax=Labilithrix luteola TaxID=1391654 RepID=A0A0K1PMM1_9BACT|nr:hypothetical protein [Labilithrix luteola]AKU94757.1 hypothetical protein AKJ09_01421 [Labilithrix luteola]
MNTKNVLVRCRNWFTRLAGDTRGEMVEYAIVVGVVALSAIAAYTAFGDSIKGKIQEEGGKVTSIRTG